MSNPAPNIYKLENITLMVGLFGHVRRKPGSGMTNEIEGKQA
jgi:hypothetical protein